MGEGNAPQFRGVDKVIEAYENADIPAFAVCYLKDINLRFDGEDLQEGKRILKAWLQRLQDDGTRAIYQLRLYEDLSGKTIKSNTPYDMAFKFVLNDRDSSSLPAKVGSSGIDAAELIRLLNENADLRAENAILKYQLEDDQEDEPEKPPEQSQPTKSIGEILLEKFTPAMVSLGERIADALVPPVAKVSGVVLDTGNISEEKEIAESITRLKHALPDKPGVAAILKKLADMSERAPGELGFYVGVMMKKNF